MGVKLACVVGAGLLLSASIVAAIPRGNLAGGAVGANNLAPFPAASRHSHSSSSSSSSSSSTSRSSSRPAARSSGPSGWSGSSGSAARGSAAPTTRAWSGNQGSNWNGNSNFNNGPRWVRPPARFARRHYPIRYLTPLFIAGAYYYPYRYLPYDGPVCAGVSENGCQMQWMEVPAEDADDAAWQCVEFCPQQ